MNTMTEPMDEQVQADMAWYAEQPEKAKWDAICLFGQVAGGSRHTAPLPSDLGEKVRPGEAYWSASNGRMTAAEFVPLDGAAIGLLAVHSYAGERCLVYEPGRNFFPIDGAEYPEYPELADYVECTRIGADV